MITSNQCFKRFGDPRTEKYMTIHYFSDELRAYIPALPARIYCHQLLVEPLNKALKTVLFNRLEKEIKTWDGCFNIRSKKGGASMSLHAWGLAIDINAAWNGFNKTPTMDMALVQCFTDAGFDWGGYWTRPDGMHFQLAELS